ncbi:MAG: TonB-dependent receptor [Acidobacteria bacterium]|nr:MAG: TonB-dependent receptor [Acidobacteriota bacterium]
MRRSILVVAFLATFLVVGLFAQTNLGRIVGTVRDNTGGVIPGVTLVVLNEGTSWTREFLTNETGGYEIANLVAGTYTVSAEMAGFRRFVRPGVVLDSGRTVRIDVQMEIGEVSNEVRVESSTPLVESETPSISNSIDYEGHMKSAVSTGNRPWEALVSLPNFVSGSATFVYSLAGSRGSQLEIHVDGIGTPAAGSPLGSGTMTMEGTSELRVLAVNSSAEYSQPAILQQISRSGTNDFHGSLRYYHNNSALNAKPFFAPTKAASHDHTFGAWFGGPLVLPKLYNGKDRTFFMLSYDGNFSPGFAAANANVPTAAMRAGDFTVQKTIKDPLTNVAFPQNKIPADRINPVSKRIQERFYPLPNYGDTSVLAALNHRIIFDNSVKGGNLDLRVDQKLSDQNTIYARVGWVQFNVARMEANLPTVGPRSQLRNLRSVVVSDTHSFSGNLINEFRLGFHRSFNQYHGPQRGLEVLADVGIQGIQNAPDAYGIPVISITGMQQLTQVEEAALAEQMHQLSDSMTWIRGDHTWKFGVDVRREHPNTILIPPQTYGAYTFNGFFTGGGSASNGIAYADFLLGLHQQTSKTFPAPADYRRQTGWGFFLNDDFKISPRLTLQLGLRYEYETPVSHLRDTMYNFDPASGQLILASQDALSQVSPLFNKSIQIGVADGSQFPTGALYRADRNNLAPRVGFAFRPTHSSDFVVRAGFGLFFDRLGTGLVDNSLKGPFTPGDEIFTNKITAGKALFEFPQAFGPTSAGASKTAPAIEAVNPDLLNPIIHQWNLSLEKEWYQTGFRISYIGVRTNQLVLKRDINKPLPSTAPFNQNRRPYPAFQDILYNDRGGNAYYDALQIEAKRRFSALSFNFGYTWANNISDVQDSGYRDAGALLANPFDRQAERGREAYAIQHRFVGQLIWQIPVGRGRRALSTVPAYLDHVLGGWETIWTMYAQSGRWFNPTFTVSDPSNTNTIGGRPDRIADGRLADWSLERYFDTAAFVIPPANSGRFGNCGRNVLEGPGIKTLHLGLAKNFTLHEDTRLMLELAVRNLLNHPNFGNPTPNLSNPTNVGRITSLVDSLEMGAVRTMQVRLRLSW